MKILITGASGFVGAHLGIRLQKNHGVLGWVNFSPKKLPFPSTKIDLKDSKAITSGLNEFHPEVIVHLAAMSKVIECEDNPRIASEVNVDATAAIANWAAEHSIRMVFTSSDQVFDGRSGPYREDDKPNPVNVYGRTKLDAERVIQEKVPDSLIVRSNSVVGHNIGWGESFSDIVLKNLRENPPFRMFQDQYRSNIHIRRMLELLESACVEKITGILHGGGPEPQSRFEMGLALARAYGIDLKDVIPASFREHPRADIMHEDGRFDISKLKSEMPHIRWRPIEEEFEQDAAEEGARI